MPFQSLFAFPTGLPLVKVFFNGLMIVKPNAGGTECEVFVHKTGTDHELSIEIRLKQPNRPDQTIMRHLGQLEQHSVIQGRRIGFLLTTDTPQGIFGYRGPATTTVDPISDPLVVFDLNVHHPGKSGVDTANAEPGILMNDALFYCAEKTVPGLEVELQKAQTGQLVTPLGQICAILGANIYATSVNVAWREKGHPQAFPLTNDIPPNAYYEVYINNDPPYVPLPPAGQQPHDELGEYYKILPNVPAGEKLKLFFKKIPRQGGPVAPQDKGSTRLPCMPIIDNGT